MVFKALVVREDENKEVFHKIEEIDRNQLSHGDVLVKVAYSSVNYKDMLAVQTNGGVIRHYPMVPGIDFSGIVVESQNEAYKEGDKIVSAGSDLGVSQPGGYSEYVQAEAEWLNHLPAGLSLEQAAIYGTAGFTAAQSIDRLIEHGMDVEKQPQILVTGASGGVGSIAVQILAKIGYKNITALIRKDYQEEVVREAGATAVIWPEDLGDGKKLLQSSKYDFVLDTVGGDVAAKALTLIKPFGSISMCGNAGGVDFNTNVMPLILRGVTILGIYTIDIPVEYRDKIWNLLGNEWNVADRLQCQSVQLDNLDDTFDALKNGKHLGRTIVEVDKKLQ